MEMIHLARQAVADRYDQIYTKNAIMNGEWDRGNLVKDEYQRIADMAPQNEADENEDG